MPWLWDVVYYCTNLQTGQVLHFPAGTYHAQVADQWGKKELSMMERVFQAWRTFSTKAADWGDLERRVVALTMDAPPLPSHRLDDLIIALWPVPLWTNNINQRLRNG